MTKKNRLEASKVSELKHMKRDFYPGTFPGALTFHTRLMSLSAVQLNFQSSGAGSIVLKCMAAAKSREAF